MSQHALSAMGRHLQQLRTQRGLSLSQLALNAGIAKSNLSHIEQGKGNPTLNTIWRLAVQLDVPFSTLIAPLSKQINEQGIDILLLEQGNDSPRVDVYRMSMAANTCRQAEAHACGTTESVTVLEGSLKVGSSQNEQHLTVGQTHNFTADEAHSYRTDITPANCLIVITYGDSPQHGR